MRNKKTDGRRQTTVTDRGLWSMVCGLIGLLSILILSFPTVCFSWTQTDWSGGDSQFFWCETTRYDTGVNVVGDNPAGAVSMTDTGLVAFWGFNIDGDTNIYDLSSYDNDGALYGTGELLENRGAEEGTTDHWSGFDGVTADTTHSGTYAFYHDLTGSALGIDYIEIDTTNKTYYLSGWAKAYGGDGSVGKLYLGYIPYDENKVQIGPQHVLPYAAGTETTLYEACGTDSTIIKIVDGTNWGVYIYACVAFDVDDSGSYNDLPNRNVSNYNITRVEDMGIYWEVEFNTTCGQSYSAGTKVREHKAGSTYIYNAASNADVDTGVWTEYSGTITGELVSGISPVTQWWSGTKYARVIMLLNSGKPTHSMVVDDFSLYSVPPTYTWVDGVFGKALDFNGIDNYVDCESGSSLDFGTGDFTVEAWVYQNELNSYQSIFHNGQSAFSQDLWISAHNGALYVRLDNVTEINSGNIPASEWVHIAVTRDGTDVDGYINGIFTASGTSSVDVGDSNGNTVIGKDNQEYRYFDGAIDEVKIYDHALSADEIAAHADTSIIQSLGDNAPRGVLLSSTFDADSPVVWKTIEWNDPSTLTNPYERGDSRLRKDEATGLVGLWHFDEGENLTGGTSADDSTVYDESTNSNTGIVHGCVWGDASEDSAVFQSALSFDGTNDYVDCGTNSVFNVGDGDHTFEAWIYPASITGTAYRYIVAIGNNAVGEQSAIGVRNSGIFHSAYSAPIINSTYKFPSVNQWYHVAVVHVGGETDKDYLYINGEFKESQDIIIGATTGKCRIGCSVGHSSFFDGAIDEVAIYSRAKTAEEIWQDARGTQTRLRTQTTSSILDGTGADSPIGLWHFDNLENSSTSVVAYDSSVYGNDGDFKGTGEPAWYQWGMFGKCVEFDGTDDYIQLPASNVLASDSGITLAAWVKADASYAAANPDARIVTIHRGSAAGTGLNIVIYSDKWQSYTHNGTTGAWLDSGVTVDTDWHFIVVTNDGTTHRIYVDGAEKNDRALGFTAGTRVACIGHFDASAGQTYAWKGLIDEVAIYNYARSSTQIAMDARGWSRWSPYYKNADEDEIVLYKDNFNDGDVGMGGYWQDYGTGTWLIDNTISDTGALKITGLTSGDTGIIQANNTNWYNYQVEAKVKLKAGSQAGIILNYNRTGSNNGYAALLDEAAEQIGLYAMDTNGVTTAAPLKTYTYTLNADTWYTLKAQYDGSRIRVYMGDKIYITYPSSTSLVYTYKGYAGLIASTTIDNAEARFDDFKVFPIDRYCRYEATLTDNVCRDTTPYLYWVRLTYEDTTSDDSIWSRIIQDRYTYSTLTPRDTSITPAEFNYTDIDGADTVWCYNLENYDNQGDNIGVPNGAITVNVATPTTASRVDLRLGIRKTTAVNYPDEWPEDIDDYDWSDWRQYESGYGAVSGDTITWELTYSTTNLATDFATEGGYILQSRAVSSDGTEPDPTNFQPNDDNDRRDTAIIYMMRDITPPGSANTTGGVDGTASLSGYDYLTCANSGTNTLWTNVGVKSVISYPENATAYTSYNTNSEYVWFNIDSVTHDSGIRVKVVDQNQASGRTTDCSDLDETDSSIRYRYSLDGGNTWNASASETNISADIAEWAFADTNIWTDRYIVIKDAPAEAKTADNSGTGADNYRYSVASLDPGASDYATKGENVLIQLAQKDKAGNWGYSHRAATYYATQTSGCSTTGKGYYINVDLLAPDPRITAGPREANYSTSASFEFDDNSANDSPLLSAFKTMLQQGPTKADPASVAPSYRSWTSYQPWSPTSDEGSAIFTDLSTTATQNWYRCFVMAKDEALNECSEADSAVYYFQCLTPVPNTIIYSGPSGIITSPTSTYSATFKFKGEGGTPSYTFAYSIDGSAWTNNTTGTVTISSLGYGNHTFRVRAANSGGDPVTGLASDTDQTPASVTFTIEDPAHPSAVAPPSDPVKYWREESE
ncbi:LamG domain-containing protein [bacterium]|nr:LamG domain-containing protein [bacterium]